MPTHVTPAFKIHKRIICIEYLKNANITISLTARNDPVEKKVNKTADVYPNVDSKI